MVRYVFGAVGSAVVLPAVESIGVGWFSTISAVLLLLGAIGLWVCVRRGAEWREKADMSRKMESPVEQGEASVP